MSEAQRFIDSSSDIFAPPDFADPTDRNLKVNFYWDALKNEYRSRQTGKAEFDKCEMVEISAIGSKDVYSRKVTEEDKKRFPGLYLKFKRNSEEPPDGTPIEKWPQLDISQVKSLKANGISTVEQLAALTDINVQALGMGYLEYRKKAIAFLEVNENVALAQKYAVENERLKSEIEALKAQFVELQARVDSEKKRGPGRPKKQESWDDNVKEVS